MNMIALSYRLLKYRSRDLIYAVMKISGAKEKRYYNLNYVINSVSKQIAVVEHFNSY